MATVRSCRLPMTSLAIDTPIGTRSRVCASSPTRSGRWVSNPARQSEPWPGMIFGTSSFITAPHAPDSSAIPSTPGYSQSRSSISRIMRKIAAYSSIRRSCRYWKASLTEWAACSLSSYCRAGLRCRRPRYRTSTATRSCWPGRRMSSTGRISRKKRRVRCATRPGRPGTPRGCCIATAATSCTVMRPRCPIRWH